MKVYKANEIGYCFGVNNAIKIAKQVRDNYYDKNVYVFGELVHNDNVTLELKKYGINTISNKDVSISRLTSFKKDDIVIFTAHGHNKIYDKILKEKGIMSFDAICPRVKQNNTLIKEYLKVGDVIYIGKENHPETLASLSISKRICFFDVLKGGDFSKIKTTNPLVINQTTLSLSDLEKINKIIKDKFKDAIFKDDVCQVTKKREDELKNINDDISLIVIVGSNKSSNTDKLYLLAKELYKDKLVIKIQNVEELKNIDFKNINSCFITSGTSTPIYTINEIANYLEEI